MTLKEFKKVMFEIECASTDFPYPVKINYSDKKANALTRCILDYFNIYLKSQAERINNTGMYREKWLIDPITNKKIKKQGKGIWSKGTGTNGTADISAMHKGKSFKIEVKIGKDRQSEEQKKYQDSIEKNGGIYMIARNWEQFYTDIQKYI